MVGSVGLGLIACLAQDVRGKAQKEAKTSNRRSLTACLAA